MEEIYTTEEVAQYLKVATKTVREWIGRGDLAAIDLGQGYRILQSDLQAFLEQRKRAIHKKGRPHSVVSLNETRIPGKTP